MCYVQQEGQRRRKNYGHFVNRIACLLQNPTENVKHRLWIHIVAFQKRKVREEMYTGKKMQQTAAFEGISSYIRNYFFDDNQAERNPITKLTCGLFELDDF